MATEILLLIGAVIYLWGSVTSPAPRDQKSGNAPKGIVSSDQKPLVPDESPDNTGTSI